MLLQEFDINLVKKKYIKGQSIADLIANFSQDGDSVLHKEFLDEFQGNSHHQQCTNLLEGHQRCDFDEISIPNDNICLTEDEPTIWTLYFDGSKCSHGAGAGINLVSPTNEVIPMAYNLGFDCINNMTEYEALILGLKDVVNLKIKDT